MRTKTPEIPMEPRGELWRPGGLCLTHPRTRSPAVGSAGSIGNRELGVILVLLTLAKRDWPVVLVPWKDVSDECEEKTVCA